MTRRDTSDNRRQNLSASLKLPVYADFKKFGKSKLSVLNQARLLMQL